MVLSSVIALAVLVPTAAEALALLCVCYAALTFAAASVWSLPADVAPTPEHVAVLSAGSRTSPRTSRASSARPRWARWSRHRRGSFVPALVLSGVLGLVGAFSYLVIVGRVEPLPVD